VSEHIDYILVGGGLQNGLLALAIRAHQPQARIAMIERGDAPGGNHTWCFHGGDVADHARGWIEPLVVRRWGGYDVAFPTLHRNVSSPYAMVTSERLAVLVTHALASRGSALHTRTTAVDVGAHHVTIRTANGTTHTLNASAVIDARGPDHAAESSCGWQKFVGHEVVLDSPHELTRPILMDATVPQLDGFRFMYVLPLSPTRLLVEDTYFSDRPYLDVASVRDEIAAYCTQRGWRVHSRAREEVGVLPLPWRADPPVATAPLVAGYAGGWFHPVTGYSFPIAARVASVIASQQPVAFAGPALAALATEHGRQMRFALRLNHMLFRWYPPDQRHHVLEQFYRRLPDATIARFYSLELTALDRARMMLAPPPRGLSLRAALGGTLPGGTGEVTS
jgi:lycopene beta-cyclase